jgi:hypothetical protein
MRKENGKTRFSNEEKKKLDENYILKVSKSLLYLFLQKSLCLIRQIALYREHYYDI